MKNYFAVDASDALFPDELVIRELTLEATDQEFYCEESYFFDEISELKVNAIEKNIKYPINWNQIFASFQ